MESSSHKYSIKTLVDLAAQGHYPLIPRVWIDEAISEGHVDLTGRQKTTANRVIRKIFQYKNIEKQKILLHSLKQMERKIFVKAFIKMVEGKVLSNTCLLH